MSTAAEAAHVPQRRPGQAAAGKAAREPRVPRPTPQRLRRAVSGGAAGPEPFTSGTHTHQRNKSNQTKATPHPHCGLGHKLNCWSAPSQPFLEPSQASHNTPLTDTMVALPICKFILSAEKRMQPSQNLVQTVRNQVKGFLWGEKRNLLDTNRLQNPPQCTLLEAGGVFWRSVSSTCPGLSSCLGQNGLALFSTFIL